MRPQRRVKVDSAVRPLYTEDLLQILAREQLDQTALIVARSRVGHLYKSKLSARELSRTPEL